MAEAFGWGTLAGFSLVIGSVLALLWRIPLRVIGLIMGFGAGVLISAVAFDLIEEAAGKTSGQGSVAAGVFAGCAVFFGGDLLIDRLGGGARKAATGGQGDGSPLAIVLGSVLDGVPESMVIGLTIVEGGAVGAAYLGGGVHLQPARARGRLSTRQGVRARLVAAPQAIDQRYGG